MKCYFYRLAKHREYDRHASVSMITEQTIQQNEKRQLPAAMKKPQKRGQGPAMKTLQIKQEKGVKKTERKEKQDLAM